jgi:hypothetical protein
MEALRGLRGWRVSRSKRDPSICPKWASCSARGGEKLRSPTSLRRRRLPQITDRRIRQTRKGRRGTAVEVGNYEVQISCFLPPFSHSNVEKHCNSHGGAGNPAMMMHMRLVRNTDCVELATRHLRLLDRPYAIYVSGRRDWNPRQSRELRLRPLSFDLVQRVRSCSRALDYESPRFIPTHSNLAPHLRANRRLCRHGAESRSVPDKFWSAVEPHGRIRA